MLMGDILLAFAASGVVDIIDSVKNIVHNTHTTPGVGKVYDLALGKVVEKLMPKMDFSISHIAVNESTNELYFIVKDRYFILTIEYNVDSKYLIPILALNLSALSDEEIIYIPYSDKFDEQIESVVKDPTSMFEAINPVIIKNIPIHFSLLSSLEEE